ncbi:VanZ family protein [Zooshikella harenae]|uniref:VanZ family protein n=1 Tax=Zooshikella harenae TaxID=2827238 RepID=A0ABS5ZA44_9GAMM|nr:VanZ family protein [Zooshikella harenae]MBU2710160.1 VanZ family protein [Zooshikella harenae]
MFRYIPVVAFFGFICWVIVSADSGQQIIFMKMMAGVPYGDKLGHVFLYGVLTWLLNSALNYKLIQLRGKSILLGAVIVFSFALLEEITQLYFPQRTFELIDLTADVVGITIFSWVPYIFYRRKQLNMLID